MTDIISAIKAIKEDAVAGVAGEDINKITWHDGNPTNITKAQILAKQTELQAEYDAQEYARAREKSYPVTKEFIEADTEKEIGGDTTKWDAYVVNYNKVRSDNQKP